MTLFFIRLGRGSDGDWRLTLNDVSSKRQVARITFDDERFVALLTGGEFIGEAVLWKPEGVTG